MNNPTLYISTPDHRLLTHLVGAYSGKSETVHRLRGELARAVVLEPATVPSTAVGLNSRVRFEDLDTHEVEEYVVTLPSNADPDRQRISVLAPIGTALLGYSVGQEIEWPTPGGMRRLKLRQVAREEPLPTTS